MGYRFMFVTGFAVGYVVGTRAGREKYDQMVEYGKQVAEHPAVQKATQTVKAKAPEVTKTAMAKAPDIAKSATQLGTRVVSSAKDQVSGHLPSKLGGSKTTAPGEDNDVSTDGRLIYPAEDSRTPADGARYS